MCVVLRRPDECNGSYQQFCDESRQYKNITQILQHFNRYDLLTYMALYWKDYQGQDESFWEHEWGKHGTCISTFDTKCYTDYVPTQEVVDYFEKTLQLFSVLDTFAFLKDAGIVPSVSKTYTYSEIRKALVRDRNVNATIECSGKNGTELDEVYYYYNVYGSAQDGIYIPAQPGMDAPFHSPYSILASPCCSHIESNQCSYLLTNHRTIGRCEFLLLPQDRYPLPAQEPHYYPRYERHL